MSNKLICYTFIYKDNKANLGYYHPKAANTQNETNIQLLHCLCIMREKLLQRS